MASELALPARPSHYYKDALVYRRFSNSSLHPFSHQRPSCLRPLDKLHLLPTGTIVLPRPIVREIPQRDRWLLFARHLGSTVSSSSDRASTIGNDADEAPGVPAGREQLGHATALDVGLLLPSFTPRQLIHHTSSHLHRERQRCVSTLTGCVTSTSYFCQSLPRLVSSREGVRTGADCAATRPMEKILHAQHMPR